jgi:hypothetical protein
MTASLAERYHFSDFTEANYRRMLEVAGQRYYFEPFDTRCGRPHVLWRHDVDLSVHRALRLAQIEAELGVRATYFLLLHSEFYNLLERAVRERIAAIAALGHWLGLHFDAGFYGGVDSPAMLEKRVAFERHILSETLEQPIDAIAFHMPEVTGTATLDSDRIVGMINANSRRIREGYSYVSDSNGYWRFRRLPDVIAAGDDPRLHVLTHAEWWQHEAMSPRERVARCIEGRARTTQAGYDDLLRTWGRESVG